MEVVEDFALGSRELRNVADILLVTPLDEHSHDDERLTAFN